MLIGITVKIEDTTHLVREAADAAIRQILPHAAERVRDFAVDSIDFAFGPSRPGEPPHTHTGALPRAIQTTFDGDSALAGPTQSGVGIAGYLHELAGTIHGFTYRERPFMWPALKATSNDFAGDFAGSITG